MHLMTSFKFGMVIGIDIRFLETITNKLGCPPGGRIANNPIWLLPDMKSSYPIILPPESSVI